ncbi:MAG TPA: tetratricopeptide repeat protein, partial [Spirochaetes bacterium]|nr:tetratricopeptide repeat protein [Spirochaetota bacterium]
SKRKYYKAIKSFKQFVRKNTPLNDYGIYYLGQSYFKLKQYSIASQYFRKIRTQYPGSRFLRISIELEGESYLRLKQSSLILRRFASMSDTGDPSISATYSYYLGVAYQDIKRPASALSHYFKVLRLAPVTWGKRVSQRISKLSRMVTIGYRDKGFIDLAIAYYYLKNPEKAIFILNKVRLGRDTEAKYKYYYYLAKSHLKLDNVSKGRFYLKKAMNTSSAGDKWVAAAFLYYKSLESTNLSAAIQGYRKIVHTYPSSLAIPAAEKLVTYYHRRRNPSMKALYLKYLAHYNQSQVIWDHLFHAINQNNLREIVRYFPSVVQALTDEKQKSKFYYWLGVAALKIKDYSKSRDFFSRSYLSYKYNYYSYKSLLYIQAYGRKKVFTPRFTYLRAKGKEREQAFFRRRGFLSLYQQSFYPLKDGKHHPILNRALYCYEADYPGLGREELTRFLNRTTGREKFYRGLSYYFRYNKKYQESIRFAYKLVDHLNGITGNNYIPPELKEYCYPRRYENVVQKASNRYNVSKYLIMAVIREESRFNPQAHSWAGARGLMQIMPRTGRSLARQTNVRRYSLYNVETNIRFGAYYLAQLIRQFNSYSYALASYNGGPGRMAGRLRKAITNGKHILTGEHLIELISNHETRNYVK